MKAMENNVGMTLLQHSLKYVAKIKFKSENKKSSLGMTFLLNLLSHFT